MSDGVQGMDKKPATTVLLVFLFPWLGLIRDRPRARTWIWHVSEKI